MRDAFKNATIICATILAAYALAPTRYMKYEVVLVPALSLSILGVAVLLRAGLVNFGYGMYVASGAYAVALAYKHLGLRDVAILTPLSIIAGALVGAVTGLATAKLRGIFYALMSLALSMVLYGLLLKLYYITGGSDGITVVELAVAGRKLSMDHLAIASAISLAFAYVFSSLFAASNMGHIAVGIKENELRLKALGVNTSAAVTKLTITSGALGGLSGALLSYLTWHVSPELAHWSTSATYVIGGIVGEFINPSYGFLIGSVVLRTIMIASYEFVREFVIGAGLLLVLIAMSLRERKLQYVARSRASL